MRVPAFTDRTCPHCSGTGKIQQVDGLWARDLRTALGLSLRDMGRRMGLSSSHLGALELGQRAFTPALWKRYEKALKGATGG